MPDKLLAGSVYISVEFDSGPLAGLLRAETTFEVLAATTQITPGF